jgi:hypothetical protein
LQVKSLKTTSKLLSAAQAARLTGSTRAPLPFRFSLFFTLLI